MADGYFKDHWTLSEWLHGSKRAVALVTEDANKRERLRILRDVAGVPSACARRFRAVDVTTNEDAFRSYAEAAGDAPYAVRLACSASGTPIRRTRGRTVSELADWVRHQEPPLDDCECEFEPHVESRVSAIFVVGTARVWGEGHAGPLLELNRGISTGSGIQFVVDGDTITTSQESLPVESLVRVALASITLHDPDVRRTLVDKFGAQFTGHLLRGYFEVIADADGAVYFVDYNRLLVADDSIDPGRDSGLAKLDKVLVTGQVGCAGRATGPVFQLLAAERVSEFPDHAVLVSRVTTPALLPAMARAAAVVTEIGGILSHAAIACRELEIPCIVGTANATSVLLPGQLVEVDASHGVVRPMVTGS